MKRRTTSAALWIVLALQAAPALSQSETACGDKAYENHNQIDPKPLKLATIQGRGVIEIRDGEIKPNEPVAGACLSLFRPDEKFLVSAKADANGEFQFDRVAPGRYRLIARAPGFCPANIPVLVVRASKRGRLQRQEVVVHYRLRSVDSCSWGAPGKRNHLRSPASHGLR